MRAISAVVGLVVLVAASPAQDSGRAKPSLLKATFSKLPIYFIENRGVYPDEVAYYVQGADKTLFFTRDGITFRLRGKDRGWVVKLEFVGANPDVVPRGEDRQRAVFSYFKGPEKDWKTGLKTYAKVVYEDLWPGIDLVYKGTVNRLKYEFVVRPGADPQAIRLRWEGATTVELTESGGLRIETPVGSFEDEPPVAWQGIDDRRVAVEAAFSFTTLNDEGGQYLGFRVGSYDRRRPLILDPAVLVYCGYVGGAKEEFAENIAVDSQGYAYVVGTTSSSETTFPVKNGPDVTYNQRVDGFVAKVDSTGAQLIYCGYLGGSEEDRASGVAIDRAGNAFVSGFTRSDERSFPVTVGPDLSYNGPPPTQPYYGDAFVAKLDPSGTHLIYCGYIGGSDHDYGISIGLDGSGSAYVTGHTRSDEKTLPVRRGPDLTFNGRWDAFIAKVNPYGTSLDYCGYIGGAGEDLGRAIAVDASGNAYVTGQVEGWSQGFPIKSGPDLTPNGLTDAFVAKVNASGLGLDYCGYVGGSASDCGWGIDVDSSGAAYIVGDTSSTESSFPVRIGPDLTYNGGSGDAFVAKVHPDGRALVYCGYIGGALQDTATGTAVDARGRQHVAGGTLSPETSFPVREGPDLTYNGKTVSDAYVAGVHPSGKHLTYCGYIGGGSLDDGTGIAVDPAGNAHVCGDTYSTESSFPIRIGPDLTHNSSGRVRDGFIAKISFFARLAASGVTRPGGRIDFGLTTYDDAGLPYQLGTSLGTGPIPIDTRKIDLGPDNLLLVTVNNYWPWIFSGYRGVIDSKGQAQAAIHIPNIPALIGLRLHSAFVTLDPAAPSGIRSISNTFSFSITK